MSINKLCGPAPGFGASFARTQSQNPQRSGATPAVLLNRPSQICTKSGRGLRGSYPWTCSKGYTLVELLVVMAIFITVIIISSYAFERISKGGGQQARSAANQFSGIVGLEVLRSDLQHAGYALPWSLQGTPTAATYPEVTAPADDTAEGIDPGSFNDGPTGVPRAIVSGTSASTGMDYLVVKSVAASLKTASQRWAFVNYSGGGVSGNSSYIKKWNSVDDIATNDRVITMRDVFNQDTGATDRQLVMNGAAFSYAVTAVDLPDAYSPSVPTDHFLVYAIDDASDLRMPFNRSDFYVATPATLPKTCAPGTGVFYKAVARHSDGNFDKYPLLDCVGDMQVIYDLDTTGSGALTTADTLAGLSAAQIRQQLKTVRVYLLTHEGKKDSSYTYPVADTNKAVVVGIPTLPSLGRVWKSADMQAKFGADWRMYRWKVQTVAVRPDNLN